MKRKIEEFREVKNEKQNEIEREDARNETQIENVNSKDE